jgi:hypothetical protein
MQEITYELKYCERCGSLGLRRSQSGETYCEPCGQLLTSYSLPGDPGRRSFLRRTKPLPAMPPKRDIEAQAGSSCGRLQ